MRSLLAALTCFLALSRAGYASGALDDECLKCHARAGFSRTTTAGEKIDLHVDSAAIRESAHAALTCVDCHVQMAKLPHKPMADFRVDCRRCHAAEHVQFARSVHGIASSQNDPDAPDCASCHGNHGVLRVKVRVAEFRREIVAVCLGCHTDERLVARHNLPRSAVIVGYQSSVHGDALIRGSAEAPTCADCHGSHLAGPIDGKESHDLMKVPDLCGRCHKMERDRFMSSVHGAAVAAGDRESPVCTGCHGEHLIRSHSDPASAVAPENLPRTCGSCHEALDMQTRHELPTKRLETYRTSYHGTLNRLGKTYAAECASCHGYHDILPSTDPASRVHKSNLAKTCGECHPADPEAFEELTIHAGLGRLVPKPRWQLLLESAWIWPASIAVFTMIGFVAALLWRQIAMRRAVHR